ncbi:MAG: hypothetical protein V8R91_11385 [Butyricimonas faecihominis]
MAVRLGIRSDLFNNRIGIRMDYYYKYSDDLLYDVEIPNLYVPMSQMRNAMAVINKGFEFDIQADIFRNTEVKMADEVQYVQKLEQVGQNIRREGY